MSDTKWEYCIEIYGTVWKSPKPENVQAFLNEMGAQGWEIINLHHPENSNKVWVTAKRPLTETEDRRRRRQRDWEFN